MNGSQTSRQIYKDASVISQPYNVPTTLQPDYPTWPTSLPGPFRVLPPPGTRPINAIRSEQLVMLGYDQATGKPAEVELHHY